MGRGRRRQGCCGSGGGQWQLPAGGAVSERELTRQLPPSPRQRAVAPSKPAAAAAPSSGKGQQQQGRAAAVTRPRLQAEGRLAHTSPAPPFPPPALLVGLPGAQVKAALEAELPGKRVLLVPEHSMMTMDFSLDRVRIIYSRETGLVVAPPRLG